MSEENAPDPEPIHVADEDYHKRQSLEICPTCSNRGYRFDCTRTETLAGVEVRTVAALACPCFRGREISYLRLALVERKEVERRGPGWMPAHRRFDELSDIKGRPPGSMHPAG